ncbi:META domain-containing protein [Streptomyces paludis]|uniref:META domain-containing protein n=1 Tax=Streptomyces paludis TaxID=2282738 RepID=A0A345HPY2_9ACTN|nr:META domain-containing protein [Streptomyces paludis]AXG78756.1 META domain-containing protein [Streptomyces paludis]
MPKQQFAQITTLSTVAVATTIAALLITACGTETTSGSASDTADAANAANAAGTGENPGSTAGATAGAGSTAGSGAGGRVDVVTALPEVLRNTQGTNGVKGSVWRMDSVTVGGKKITPVAQAPASLRVGADGTFRLSPDCNIRTTEVTVDGGALVVSDGPGRSTMMYCPEEQHPFADAFDKVFTGKLSATLSDDPATPLTLTLTGATGDSIDLTRDSPAPLVGTDWRLDGVIDTVIDHADTEGSLPSGTDGKASLTFSKGKGGASGTVEGTSGCNVFRGSARLSEATNKITFGALRMTKKACSKPEKELEERMAKVLSGEIAYELSHNQLKLITEDGLGISATTPLRR